MTGFRNAAVLSMIVVDGCERDPGGRCRHHGDVSVVRRRDPLRARPARALQAGLRGLHGPPRSRPVHPPHRRRPRRRRLRPSLQPGAAARRRVLLAHGRGPRAAAVWGRRAPRGLQAARDAAAVAATLLRRRAAGALRRHPRRLARRALAPPQRLHRRRRTAVRHARARSRVRARTGVQRTRSAQVQRHASRSGQGNGRDRPRGQGARGGRRRPPVDLRGGLRRHGRAGRVPAGAQGPRLRLDGDGGRPGAAGDDPAARRRSRRRQGLHRQGGVLRRRRAQPPGAGRAAGRGDVGPLRRLRADPARRRGLPAC